VTVSVEARRAPASVGLVFRVALVLLALASGAAGCASSSASTPHAPGAARATSASTPGFVFARDTFAFRNEIRARHPDVEDLYANYCFVLAKGLRQFFQSARFDPAAPKLDHAGYVERVRAVKAYPVWKPPLSLDDRVVIPGYADLREFSGAETDAVKEGLGGRFWTMVHWTNWRVTFPVTASHQANVADEIADDLREGRLVQLLVTNWPVPELNHTVVAFAFRDEAAGDRVFDVWDPNDPDGPGKVTFDHERRRFWATDVYDTRPGPIRVFRMYYSRLL
jgi:hypothetical protein